ncbi:MAG TPA: AMP-binding protein, partial [Oligoflexia bacterium]|nr:AMP-binding protein [Oligoflexia bacterium]
MNAAEQKSLVDVLRGRARETPDRLAFNFLLDGESLEAPVTYAELDARARAIGAVLQKKGLTGKPVVLLYAPGPEYIAGFFGCLYAGAIAVPAYPPNPSQIRLTVKKLQGIMKDAGCAAVLATSDIVLRLKPLFLLSPSMWRLKWVPTDRVEDSAGDRWVETELTRDHLAFLQYTSGSTGEPKGVMLSHGNLLSNLESIRIGFGYTPDSRGMVWLPPYHDMGLIGGILCPIFTGFPVVLMSPIDFLTKPLRWLQAISKYKATVSGGPNFAYALCVRKISAEDRASLDLSSWKVAFNGAEPIRNEVLESFSQTFKGQGFKKEAFFPCYGLAESALFVTGIPPGRGAVSVVVDSAELEKNKVVLRPDQSTPGDVSSKRLVGCGMSAVAQKMLIVNPDTCEICTDGSIGEVWVSSASVAKGYWKQEERSEKTFRARVKNQHGLGAFLRTGDLGFITASGELYVTGRLKDLIIIRGRNHYPQDIERTVEQATHSVRPGCSAAFAIDVGGDEKLVVVSEVERRFSPTAKRSIVGEGIKNEPERLKELDSEAVFQAIRKAVGHNHEIQIHEIVLVRAGSVPKTSSGKIRRSTTKQAYLSKELHTVATDLFGTGTPKRPLNAVNDSNKNSEAESSNALPRVLHENQPGIEKELREKLAAAMNAPVDSLDVTQPMSSIGLDSLHLVEIGTYIQGRYGIDLSFEKFFGDTSIAALANELA